MSWASQWRSGSGRFHRSPGQPKRVHRFAVTSVCQRRVLIEAAWHYRHHPFVGERLRRRQQAAAATSVALAGTAQQRLCRRFRRLTERGKSRPKVVTALARELSGFLWAALTP